MINNNSIIRIQKDKNNPYVMLNKTFLNDENLSFKAKGILAYLLSKPDNWQVRVSDLIKHSPDGKTAIYSGLNELKQQGYLEKFPVHIDGKIHHWESIVYEIPTLSKKPIVDNQQVVDNSQLDKIEVSENLFVENLNVENLNIENRERNNNEINNIEYNDKCLLVSSSIPHTENMQGEEEQINELIIQSQVELYEDEALKENIKEIIRDLHQDPSTRQTIKKVKLSHVDEALRRYREAQETKEIKNPKLYFRKCLISAILEEGLKGLF